MFDLNLRFNNISISSLVSEDIIPVKHWLENQKFEGSNNYFNLGELSERFLESFVSESEFFVKIIKDGVFIGIVKGRIEFKKNNEGWIWCYIIDRSFKGQGLESEVLQKILEFFHDEYGISQFYTIVAEDDNESKKFWHKKGFELLRIARNYFGNDFEDIDMLILKKA